MLADNVYRCRPSEFRALPELDGMGSAIAIPTLKLESEGWERGPNVGEPSEPNAGSPSS